MYHVKIRNTIRSKHCAQYCRKHADRKFNKSIIYILIYTVKPITATNLKATTRK